MARQKDKGHKRKKKKRDEGEPEDEGAAESDFSDSSSFMEETESQKYKDFRVADYTRYYPEEGGNAEYIVFMESKNEHPLGTRDMMSLANCLKRYNKGIKQLQRINKYKIGVVFERSGLANAALKNKTFLESYELKASIPASASEVTGVITHVPIELSNSQIHAALTTTKNIVCIRRFMRKTRMDNGQVKMEPTKTVSITFSCPVLPESVDLNSWRFVLRPYIPPVMQCLKCLRYGHIAKFCKNSERCSICGDAHNFKLCTVPKEEARCIQCKGPHVAISPECPVKKQKIQLNKEKVQNKSYSAILNNEKSFPPLKQSPLETLASLLNSDQILNMVVESVVTIIKMNKNNEKISTQNIKETLLDTIKKSNKQN